MTLEEVKNWLEIVYFLSGPIIAVIAYLAFVPKTKKERSPFDVVGIKTRAATQDILDAIKESRAGQQKHREGLSLRSAPDPQR